MNDPKTDVLAREAALKQWSDIVRTQIHFNEIIHRTRQLTATVVLTAFGAAIAGFVAKPKAYITLTTCLPDMQLSTPLILAGWAFLLIGVLIDRLYYYKLLIAAVEAGEQLEKKYDLPVKLSVSLSTAVSRRYARNILRLFYFGGFLIGLGLIVFFNFATVNLL